MTIAVHKGLIGIVKSHAPLVSTLRVALNSGNGERIAQLLVGWMAHAGIPAEDAAAFVQLLGGDRRAVFEAYESPPAGGSLLAELKSAGFKHEEALQVVFELQDLLGAASPWRDAVYAPLNRARGIYAVADLQELVIETARVGASPRAVLLGAVVAAAAPTRLVIQEGRNGGRMFRAAFESKALRSPLILAGVAEDLVRGLEVEGLIISRRLIRPALAALLNAYIVMKRAEWAEA